MKFLDTHFEEYVNNVKEINIHKELNKIYKLFPNDLKDLPNLIFYGPNGVGKYSQMLYSILKYSPSELKYEKKITINYNKELYFIKISDIHYEVDMSLLGCNPKLLWHEIYCQIIDIINSKQEKIGIIVCKEFHFLQNELLENFYSYMQENNNSNLNIKFILLTKEISFLSENILNCCIRINISRPTKTYYKKFNKNKNFKYNDKNINNILNIKNILINNPENFQNIKEIKNKENNKENLLIFELLNKNNKIIIDKIIKNIIEIDNIKFLKFRDIIYDIFIYNLDIYECIYYILNYFIINDYINNTKISDLLIKTHSFFKYYNNNYRPIYHLENYLLYLSTIVHDYKL